MLIFGKSYTIQSTQKKSIILKGLSFPLTIGCEMQQAFVELMLLYALRKMLSPDPKTFFLQSILKKIVYKNSVRRKRKVFDCFLCKNKFYFFTTLSRLLKVVHEKSVRLSLAMVLGKFPLVVQNLKFRNFVEFFSKSQ